MTASASIFFAPPLIRASDAEREDSLRQLRGHWLAGRLSLDEYEERCEQAARGLYLADLTGALRELPPPAPPVVVPAHATAQQSGSGTTSLVLGILGLALVVLSMGLLFLVSLPLSTTAWTLGRQQRRAAPGATGSMAAAGEVVGIIGTVLGCLSLTACALIVT